MRQLIPALVYLAALAAVLALVLVLDASLSHRFVDPLVGPGFAFWVYLLLFPIPPVAGAIAVSLEGFSTRTRLGLGFAFIIATLLALFASLAIVRSVVVLAFINLFLAFVLLRTAVAIGARSKRLTGAA